MYSIYHRRVWAVDERRRLVLYMNFYFACLTRRKSAQLSSLILPVRKATVSVMMLSLYVYGRIFSPTMTCLRSPPSFHFRAIRTCERTCVCLRLCVYSSSSNPLFSHLFRLSFHFNSFLHLIGRQVGAHKQNYKNISKKKNNNNTFLSSFFQVQ